MKLHHLTIEKTISKRSYTITDVYYGVPNKGLYQLLFTCDSPINIGVLLVILEGLLFNANTTINKKYP